MLDIPYIKHIVVVLLSGSILWALSVFAARTRPRKLATGSGIIAPNQMLIGFLVLLCLGLAGVAIWASLFVAGSFPAPVVGAAMLVAALLIATSFLPVYRVNWDEDGITGPTSLWPIPFGPKPGRILWEDVEEVGTDTGGGWFVADEAGRKVRWNSFYSGYPHLMQEVAVQCPWLFDAPAPPRGQQA